MLKGLIAPLSATAAQVPALAAVIVQPPYVATRWYWADRYSSAAGIAQAIGTIRLNAFIVRRSITISDLCVRVSTLSVLGNVQLAIYAADPATMLPTGSALAVTGSISTTLAALTSADITGADVALVPGLYWFATNADNATVVLQGTNQNTALDTALVGSTTLANLSSAANNLSLSLTVASTFGTWPSLTSASFTEVVGTTGTVFGFKVSVGG